MIQVSGLTKHYGSQTLFENGAFVLNSRERLGLVGRNGSGKTTLFKLLVEEESVDSGAITMPKGYRIGRLQQHLSFTEPTIVGEACLGLHPDERDQTYRAEILLGGLGFSEADMSRAPAEFSGGYQIRINLARLLLSEPNLLLLDEPTNYLDIVSARWLAGALREWAGEMIIITHDRSFMDSVTTHTLMIHRGTFRKIPGSTQKLFDAIAVDEEVYEKTRLNDEKKRKDIEQFINRFRAKASKATLVQSRVKALEKMEVREQLSDESSLEFKFANREFFGKSYADVRQITFGYDPGVPLISDLSLNIGRRERIGIIGKNGRGKSTLLRLLAGELQPNQGQISTSPNTTVAYFGQTNIERLRPELTVEQEIDSARPGMHRTQVRGICGLMMFEGDKALKKVKVLSGGERSRVLLGKLIVTPSNLLLLDEPTNHLDMDSVEALKDALLEYDGSVVLVTHNEMLLRELCDRLVVFQGQRPFVLEGGYDDFLEKIGWEEEGGAKPSSRREKKPKRGEAETAEIEKAIKKLEKRIIGFENEEKLLAKQLDEATERKSADQIKQISVRMKEVQDGIEAAFEEMSNLQDN